MSSISQLPVIKPVQPWYRGLMAVRKPPYTERDMRLVDFPSTLSAFEHRMTLAPRTSYELRSILSMRLKVSERAAARQDSALGRFYNVLSGEHATYMRFLGQEVAGILALLGVDVEGLTEAEAVYDLRVDVAKDALRVLTGAEDTEVLS